MIEISNFDVQKVTNTLIGGKIYVYKKPKYKVSFCITESSLVGLLQRTLRALKYYEESHGYGQDKFIEGCKVGEAILNHLMSNGYGAYLLRVIKHRRKNNLTT